MRDQHLPTRLIGRLQREHGGIEHIDGERRGQEQGAKGAQLGLLGLHSRNEGLRALFGIVFSGERRKDGIQRRELQRCPEIGNRVVSDDPSMPENDDARADLLDYFCTKARRNVTNPEEHLRDQSAMHDTPGGTRRSFQSGQASLPH